MEFIASILQNAFDAHHRRIGIVVDRNTSLRELRKQLDTLCMSVRNIRQAMKIYIIGSNRLVEGRSYQDIAVQDRSMLDCYLVLFKEKVAA
jgi:hypothetical protein